MCVYVTEFFGTWYMLTVPNDQCSFSLGSFGSWWNCLVAFWLELEIRLTFPSKRAKATQCLSSHLLTQWLSFRLTGYGVKFFKYRQTEALKEMEICQNSEIWSAVGGVGLIISWVMLNRNYRTDMTQGSGLFLVISLTTQEAQNSSNNSTGESLNFAKLVVFHANSYSLSCSIFFFHPIIDSSVAYSRVYKKIFCIAKDVVWWKS